jgi:DNA-binding response OmpR family regulator
MAPCHTVRFLASIHHPAAERQRIQGPLEAVSCSDKVKLVNVLMLTDDRDCAQVVDAVAKDPTRTLPIMRAHDGEQAMALLDAGFVPDLLLLDLEQPGVPGVLRRLRSDSRYQYAAVVVTGSGASSVEPRWAWLPGEVWLPDPFGVDDLAMAISLALSRADVLTLGATVPHAA